MAPTLEQRLINKVLEEDGASLKTALARGVDADWFFDDQHRDAFTFVSNHYASYGNVPAPVTFAGHMGVTYPLFDVKENVEYLIDQQAKALRWDAAQKALPDVEDHLESGDVDAAFSRFRSALENAAAYVPVKSPLVDSMENDRVEDRWAAYLTRGASGTHLLGYSTGFPTIDAATLGLQPGHLVTLIASAKTGKTSVCLVMASHVYEMYKVPVFFASFEMGIRELELRQDALMAHVNFKNLQTGKLSPADEVRYEEHLNKVEDDFTWPFHFMDAAAGSTVSAMQSLIERVEPKVVFLDGIYMMTDEISGERNTPQALTNITRGLKRMATYLDIPVVINTQALLWKMKGVRLGIGSAGYASSFGQDSDVVLGLERMHLAKNETEESHETERVLRVLASRNTGLASVDLMFDFESGRIEESGSLAP